MYKLFKNAEGKISTTAIRQIVKNGICTIPFDPANSDYQAYLKWLEAGNQPEPAEETV